METGTKLTVVSLHGFLHLPSLGGRDFTNLVNDIKYNSRLPSIGKELENPNCHPRVHPILDIEVKQQLLLNDDLLPQFRNGIQRCTQTSSLDLHQKKNKVDIATSCVFPSSLSVPVIEKDGTFVRNDFIEMEPTLVKDLLLVFQGCNGSILKWNENNCFSFYTDENLLHPSHKTLVLRMCPIGVCYKMIKTQLYVPTRGKCFEALKYFFQAQLREFDLMVLGLEQMMNGQSTSVDMEKYRKIVPSGSDTISLHQLECLMFDSKKLLKAMTSMLSHIQPGTEGGHLCSVLNEFTQHGDPEIQDFAYRTLANVARPIFKMIGNWIFVGNFQDKFDEFFISINSSCDPENLWRGKFSIKEKMLPEFIPRKLAEKILATGKNINFLKELCHNAADYDGRDEIKKSLKETPVESLFLRNDPILQKTVEKAYDTTSSMVLSVLMTQCRLVDHLNAIKNYLLLGQGDFIRYLLELLQVELSKPANTVFYHDLTSILETAIRSTNAKFEPEEILSRLDVCLLTSTEKDKGWDVFCLDYKVHGPIGTVLTESVMSRYNQLFNILWRTKRIEAILSTLWKNQATLFKFQRTLPELGAVLHRSQLLISEMIHFVHQTLYYIMFEATECEWNPLMIDVAKSTDLDEVIQAHESFLKTIISRSLLNISNRELLNQLRGIFDVVYDFKSFLSKFDGAVMAEYEMRKKINLQPTEQLHNDKEFFRTFISLSKSRVETLYTTYQNLVRSFLLKLNRQQDISLQCLSFRLDFNEYYQQKDPHLSEPLTFQHRRLSMGPFSPLNYSILTSSMEESSTNPVIFEENR